MYSLIIIDDEEEILEALTDCFPWESIGFQVIGSFRFASVALDFCQKTMPDVVLTDIRLPLKSGFDILDVLIPIFRDEDCPLTARCKGINNRNGPSLWSWLRCHPHP